MNMRSGGCSPPRPACTAGVSVDGDGPQTGVGGVVDVHSGCVSPWGVRDVDLAAEMLEQCVSTGQSARRVTEAQVLRVTLRHAARLQQLRIRTARIHDTVVVVRVDADLRNDDTVTMRAKLAPRS